MTCVFSFIAIGLLFQFGSCLKSKQTGNLPRATIVDVEAQNSQLINFIQDLTKITEKETENVKVTINDRINTFEPQRPIPNRPSFAGQTGGNFRPQLIPPGTPWPSSVGNTQPPSIIPINTITTNIPIVDRIQDTPTSSIPIKPPPNRPSFSGQTGGNFRPQIIPSGTAFPSESQNSRPPPVASNKPQIVDRFKETSSKKPSAGFVWNASPISTFPPLIRPTINPISGAVIKPSQSFLPSKPRPSRPETTTFVEIVDRFKDPTPYPGFTEIINKPTRPLPNRPFYAGQTGGHYTPQLIPPGKPWPARPQDYNTYSVTSKRPKSTTVFAPQHEMKPGNLQPQPSLPKPGTVDNSEENSSGSAENDGESHSTSSKPSSGEKEVLPTLVTTAVVDQLKPQGIVPCKAPAFKPEDEMKISTTPSPQIVDRIEENSSQSSRETMEPTRPPPNRPPSAGSTGGNLKPQIIPPGTPWPAKPDESTTEASLNANTTKLEETTPLSLLLHRSTQEPTRIANGTSGTLFTSRPIATKKTPT